MNGQTSRLIFGRRDTRPNDIQYNDTWHSNKKHDAQIPVSLMLSVAFFTGTQSVVRLAVILPSVVAPIYDGLEN